MYKLMLSAALMLTILSACKKNTTYSNDDNSAPCAPKMCTQVFMSVTVKFLNKTGQPMTVSNFKAINKRTGEQLKNTGAPTNADLMPGVYVVATDANLKELADAGDEVTVTATDPNTNKTKTATFKIAGGCACHINKISGPEEITFD